MSCHKQRKDRQHSEWDADGQIVILEYPEKRMADYRGCFHCLLLLNNGIVRKLIPGDPAAFFYKPDDLFAISVSQENPIQGLIHKVFPIYEHHSCCFVSVGRVIYAEFTMGKAVWYNINIMRREGKVQAVEQYPGLYWNTLAWEQRYPGGESPQEFYERIRNAWDAFQKEIIERKENVILANHGGVMRVILSIVKGEI